MINSRSLDQLEPDFKMLVLRWLNECYLAGLDILVVSTYRDNEYQNMLYAKGRTTAGKIATNAKGGQSQHNHRLAVDFCVMDGKACDWDNVADFSKAGRIAEAVGLEWAGRWTGKLKEIGHVQAKPAIQTKKG